ncbi:HPr family phosphocarrier protein [Notoacmeibacter ruber]|uniref:HPr family phosphocarrier protein n=1 Tax=Notoacmeibacter ruber TaxID=2670375 RepID=A0A3L7JL31_9HYPH|nr:HPr family phosphocarrier protein [Notoacmeibacter ruber]RLQ89222.1 HPr family phosphocarrier protein [Notoacmeibacter ruber]
MKSSVASLDQSIVRDLPICNKRGLHARASAKFVQTVAAYDAEISVERDGLVVDGGSILDLMMLAAADGAVITVSATGPQAAEAMEALEALVAGRFGEEA